MNYYVYSHSTLDGVIRYIGSGTKARANDSGNRSKSWHKLFDHVKPVVTIIEDNLSKDLSREREQYYMEIHKETIVNVKKVDTYEDMNLDYFAERFYIDSSSPSGLRYLLQNNGTGKNKRNPHDIAGHKVTNRGKSYWTLKSNGRTYMVHRIVYLLNHKNISKDLVINHKDNDGLNNLIGNLEQVTTIENSRTKSLINKSGHVNINPNQRKNGILGYTFTGEKYGSKNKYFSLVKYGSLESALQAAVLYKSEFMKGQVE